MKEQSHSTPCTYMDDFTDWAKIYAAEGGMYDTCVHIPISYLYMYIYHIVCYYNYVQ